ncbi:Nucleophosmin [Myotis brandtii]|uniref:Nucleophosmin n=1 Tax=Myotis brandtii TaxID=109478 RepID=S7PZY4_MYOBR|nr:Nucleophosmin [Myotis brandtii]
MEESMDMGMSPLRPQNDLFGCELKADKDDHLNVDSDENEHQLSSQTASPPLFILEHLRKVRFYGHNVQAEPLGTFWICQDHRPSSFFTVR